MTLINIKDSMRCPECRSFHIYSTFGDVSGRGVLDAWSALREPKTYPQSFTTRSYHYYGCSVCGHKWNHRETNGITLTLDARKPTIMETIRGWFE